MPWSSHLCIMLPIFLFDLCNSSALSKIITTGFKALQLQYFFTAGKDEVKAWTILVRMSSDNLLHGFRCFTGTLVSSQAMRLMTSFPAFACLFVCVKLRG